MFIKTVYFTLSALVALLFLAAAAMAQGPNCGPRDKLIKILADKHGEYLIVAGTSEQGGMEMWASDKGSWTILTSMPGGITCIARSGHNLQFAHPPGPKDVEL